MTSLADDLRKAADAGKMVRRILLRRAADELDRLSRRSAELAAAARERDGLAADLARVTAERDAAREELQTFKGTAAWVEGVEDVGNAHQATYRPRVRVDPKREASS